MTAERKPAEPWDTEKAAQLAAEALRWLGRNCQECVASEVLREHEEAAHEAAMDADEERYREALRAYCRVEFLFALVLTNERERSNTKKGAVTSPSNTPYGKFSFQFGVSAVYRLTPKKGRGLEAARIGG